jgi:hypothetical protein
MTVSSGTESIKVASNEDEIGWISLKPAPILPRDFRRRLQKLSPGQWKENQAAHLIGQLEQQVPEFKMNSAGTPVNRKSLSSIY